MRTIRTPGELRAALAGSRRDGRSIGLVPTMGAFHDGHLSLMRHARTSCDVVVVSLFVNPTQFSDAGDLEHYPRDERRDAALASEAGVDVLFAPAADAVYPAGFATSVVVSGVTDDLEGRHRGRGHFDGVATVVAKLFNMVDPDVAFFGQKDAQQVAVIRQMVRDLDFRVAIEVCPTVRAADGLALSSRNMRLSGDEREQALSLSRALHAIQSAVGAGEQDPAAAIAAGRAEMAAVGITPEYLTLVDPHTMRPVRWIEGDVLAVVAAHVGPVRLIDNAPIPGARSDGHRRGETDRLARAARTTHSPTTSTQAVATPSGRQPA